MPTPSVQAACASLLAFIKEKCTKLKLPLNPELPPYVPPSTSPSAPSSSSSLSPPREVLALTYDCLYAVMEEVMLVDAKVKTSTDQAAAYLRKLKQVWEGTRNANSFLDGDALQFWANSFPSGVLAAPWGEMEAKLQAWVRSQSSTHKALGILWPSSPPTTSLSSSPSSSSLTASLSFSSSSSSSSFASFSPSAHRTPAARALQFRLEGCLTGYVSVLGLSLFVYKSTLMDSLGNFCAEDTWTPPTKDVIVTVGYPKDTEISLKQYGFVVYNLETWIDFKMWLYAQKDIRAMMKSEPNVVEFIVNNSIHPGTITMGEEIVRFLRARRILSPVTVVGIANSQILHNYDSLYLATNLDNVWALNRYHRYEFRHLAESSAKFLKQAPRHHRSDLVDTFPYKNINLPALPPITCQLEWMRILILEDNALEHLPVSIGNLTSLFRLTLTSNKLQYVPASIALLTQLRELFLNKNNFALLPTHVCKLVGLKVLNLSNNPLASLPSQIAQLTNLLDLDIHATPLTQLPYSMGDMTNLQQLTLDKDTFQSYPRAFTEGYTPDKIKFLKELQPGNHYGYQQLVLLGKESNAFKEIGTTPRKILQNLYEVELKNEKQEPVPFLVWDFTGRDISVEMAFFSRSAIYIIVETNKAEASKNSYSAKLCRDAIYSVVPKEENPPIIAVYLFQASDDETEAIKKEFAGVKSCFLGTEEGKKSLVDCLVSFACNKERPDIPKPYYMFSKFIQEHTKMFMSWSEVQKHIKHYTTDAEAIEFLVRHGYIFFHGESANFQQNNENVIMVLPPALNLVSQIKATLKGFERISLPDLVAKLAKICGESVNFQSIINLLKLVNVIHSIGEETFFLVPFIAPYSPGKAFPETSENPINLVRVYTSQKEFSREWFLNVITSIHSTRMPSEGCVTLKPGNIDSHSALITIEIPTFTSSPSPSPSSSPPLLRTSSLKEVPTTKSPDYNNLPSSAPQTSRSPAEGGSIRVSSSLPRFSFLSFQRASSPPGQISSASPPPKSSPSSSPPIPISPQIASPKSPQNPNSPSSPPIVLKCYLHRSPTTNSFFFVLSCPDISSNSEIIFSTILQNIQWLLNHWILQPQFIFSTCCYNCFDMNSFVKTKTTECPFEQAKCIQYIRELAEVDCPKCKRKIDMRFVVPDLTLPLHLERKVDAKDLAETKPLASGAYGSIYKRSDKGKDIVIKVERNEEEASDKFMREMAITSKLQHKNIISCVGLSRTPTLALLLEFAPFGSLNSVIKREELKLDRALVSRIASEIAAGMRFVHERGIAFQDLKSLNILVMSLDINSREGLVKLTDFGSAEYHMGFSIAKYQKHCTSSYKTPEFYHLNPIDVVLADIYCFGLILWELLSRKTVEDYLKETEATTAANNKQKKIKLEDKDRHFLFSSGTLPSSSVASEPMKAILNDCLQEFPKKRVQSFKEIEERFKSMKI